ncbi:hypothetical protein TSPI_01116 [Trichinella spiralis]|uniref:Uncharacterized protein n=1 Tax=Trichinella spiralis TaxID=6334 RepID=A0ABR3KN40_TRISP
MPLRRATLPSGSLCLSSELVRFQAARALLADVLATKDLPSNVRCALKKVGDLINPDSIHGGLDAFNTPPSDINFPHCGDRIAVHEDGQLLGGKSIFDWTSVSNVVGLPQMYDDKAATAHDQRFSVQNVSAENSNYHCEIGCGLLGWVDFSVLFFKNCFFHIAAAAASHP